jgi:hypothetical protein
MSDKAEGNSTNILDGIMLGCVDAGPGIKSDHGLLKNQGRRTRCGFEVMVTTPQGN